MEENDDGTDEGDWNMEERDKRHVKEREIWRKRSITNAS